MKIYAIRDRLIDYFLQPFVAPNDNEVKASIAQTINQDHGGRHVPIAANPHDFEVWRIGEVTEDGHVVPEREYLCTAASLLRGGVRKSGAGASGGGESNEAAGGSESAPGVTGEEPPGGGSPVPRNAP
ncbi:MAG: nonstructural protein [Arizlama microvirus]|nr:MAG: nonstructural protein [Arizlama microvirus]